MVVCAAGGVTVAGDRVGIGVKAGTYGIAIDVTGRINDVLAIRGSYSAFDYSDEVEVEDIEYDGDLALGGAGLMLDVHPFRNGFRLTGGYFSNRNDIELEAVPTEDIEIGDSTYTPAEVGTLDGGVDFKDSAAYFGIGYGNAASGPGRVKLVLDAGLLMQGSADISLSSDSGLVSQDDIDAEIEELEEKAEDYDFWPVLSIGISFRI